MEALKVLDYLDSMTLECDGLTNVISTLLSAYGLDHEVYYGRVTTAEGKIIPIHYWIEVDDVVIDYRLRMWFGQEVSIPHGVFKKEDALHIHYAGSQREPFSADNPVAPILCILDGLKFEEILEMIRVAFKLYTDKSKSGVVFSETHTQQ